MIFDDFGSDGRPEGHAIRRRAEHSHRRLSVSACRRPLERRGLVDSYIWLWKIRMAMGLRIAARRSYGPFDVSRDTHGNQTRFGGGFDGWLYCTHGFNNDSHVTARDGSRGPEFRQHLPDPSRRVPHRAAPTGR